MAVPTNTMLTRDEVAKEALMRFHNNLGFTRTINRQYESEFARAGNKIGGTLKIIKPARYTITSGAIMDSTIQDYTEEQVDFVVGTQKHVAVEFGSAELTMEMNDFGEKILEGAMAKLASQIDYDNITAAYQGRFTQVGTAGTTPATAYVVLQAGEKLSDYTAPKDNKRFLAVNPAAEAKIIDALKGLFHSGSQVSEQYLSGEMGRALGFKWLSTQNINRHTVGIIGSDTPLIKGASQTGSTIAVDAWTASTAVLNKGDVFTIDGVNGCNPELGTDLGYLQQFVVTADTSSSASGETLTLPISPSIIVSGPTRTVMNSPADNAGINVVGTSATTYPINLAYHEKAMTFATADLKLPSGVDFASRQVYDGISMRVVKDYDINNDNFPCRIDIYCGRKVTIPEYICGIIG